MTDYRIELQAFVDAAASFTEPALGHHKAWAEAVARARVALSMPESSASTVCPITPPPELVEQWLSQPRYSSLPQDGTFVVRRCLSLTEDEINNLVTAAARWGSDQELEACLQLLMVNGCPPRFKDIILNARRPKPLSPRELALATLRKLSTSGYPCNLQQDEDWDTIRQALEQLDD